MPTGKLEFSATKKSENVHFSFIKKSTWREKCELHFVILICTLSYRQAASVASSICVYTITLLCLGIDDNTITKEDSLVFMVRLLIV